MSYICIFFLKISRELIHEATLLEIAFLKTATSEFLIGNCRVCHQQISYDKMEVGAVFLFLVR